jgi:hypothetical protein
MGDCHFSYIAKLEKKINTGYGMRLSSSEPLREYHISKLSQNLNRNGQT